MVSKLHYSGLEGEEHHGRSWSGRKSAQLRQTESREKAQRAGHRG